MTNPANQLATSRVLDAGELKTLEVFHHCSDQR